LVSFSALSAPPVEAAPAQTPPAATVTVQAGDSLAGIARRVGVRLSALLRANELTAASVIHPGDTLIVPPGGTGPVAPATPTAPPAVAAANAPAGTYTVKPGDALARIAWRNGVKLGALVKANNLTTASLIVPGQVLQIPPATMPIPAGAPATPAAGVPTTPVAATPAPAPAAPAAAPTGTKLDAMLSFLRAQVGAPYRFFSAGPDAYDCSGLVVAGFRSVGRSVPHQSRALARLGTAVDWRTQPIASGDLVFTSVFDDPNRITHVGVALDATTWVHAVGVGRSVTITNLPPADRIMAVQRVEV
jgi:LysM repeat protein